MTLKENLCVRRITYTSPFAEHVIRRIQEVHNDYIKRFYFRILGGGPVDDSTVECTVLVSEGRAEEFISDIRGAITEALRDYDRR